MDGLVAGHTAVVTGGASGMGRAIAHRFATHGADIVVADVREEPREGGTPTQELISDTSDARAIHVRCDVSSVDDVRGAITAAEEFGGVDIMVNNAAIFRRTNFLDVDEDAYDELMDVNAKGTFFGTQVAAHRMIEHGRGGSIINLSSLAGMRGNGDYVEYCMSKGAVRLLTYAAADALGPAGIRVNAIHPGIIDTAITRDDIPIVDSDREDEYRQTIPLQRFGTPEDIADVALCLASDLTEYVSGTSIVVDGAEAAF